MKALAFFSMLLFAGRCTSMNAAAGPVEMRVAASGAYSSNESREAQALVFRDAASFEQAWEKNIDNPEIPQIDFERGVAVLLLAGVRPTGGYSVDPTAVRVEGETLIVEAGIEGPPPGSMTTQAITSPWAVIAVSTRGFKDVRWDR